MPRIPYLPQNLNGAPLVEASPSELLKDLNELKAREALPPSFSIMGSKLEFREYPKLPGQKWYKARCVTLGLDKDDFPHSEIVILTQGRWACTGYLDLPYFIYFQGDDDSSPHSVFGRESLAPDRQVVYDIRNPYKPVGVDVHSLVDEITRKGLYDKPYRIPTRYGELKAYLVGTPNNPNEKSVVLYFPKLKVVAKAFITVCNSFELQCMYNVGNMFSSRSTVPIRTISKEGAIEYRRLPIFEMGKGYIDNEGLWVCESKPERKCTDFKKPFCKPKLHHPESAIYRCICGTFNGDPTIKCPSHHHPTTLQSLMRRESLYEV